MKVTEKYNVLKKIKIDNSIVNEGEIINLPWLGYQPNFHSPELLSIFPKYPRDKNQQLLDFYYITHFDKDTLPGTMINCIWNSYIQKHIKWFKPIGEKVNIK